MKKEIYLVDEQQIGVDQALKIGKGWDKIETLWEEIEPSNDIGKIRKLVQSMFEVMEQFGVSDRITTILNYGDQNDDKAHRDGIFSIMCRYACDSSDKSIRQITDPKDDNNGFYIQKRQLEEQFKPDEDVEESEIMANAMEATNTIIQLMSNNQERMQQFGIDTRSIARTCTIMRRYFQNQLIQCRNSGGNLLVNITNGIMRVSIHGYSEPFVAPIKETEYSKLDTLINNDPCLFCKKDGTPMNSTFPIKLTETQKMVMEYLTRNSNAKDLNRVRGRIQFFSAVNNILTPPKKRKITEPVTQPIHGKGKKVDYIEENREFFKDINGRIGGYIPEEIINHLLERASYPMKRLYEKMETKIKSALELVDVPENEFEVEALKMFLYMRIAKPIAEINNGAINKGGLEEKIDDSALEYADAINLFRTLIEQNTDYKTIRRALKNKEFERQLINNQPKEDILDGEPEEELDEIFTVEDDFEELDFKKEPDGEDFLGQEDDIENVDIEPNDMQQIPEKETNQYWATKFNDFIKQLKVKRKQLNAERIKLKEYETKLRESDIAQEKKDRAVEEYRKSAKSVEEAEETLREVQEELNRRRAEEKHAYEEMTRISRELKQVRTDNKNVEQDKIASEKRATELEADIERMEKKLDELFK